VRNGRRIQRFAQGSHTVAQYAAVQPGNVHRYPLRAQAKPENPYGRNSKKLSLFSGEIGLSMRILRAQCNPAWMWRNTDVANFIGWMRHHNKKRDAARRAAFYNSSTRSSGPMKRAP
jgi:hypothetical protein